jgi:hypothetical protein
MSVLALSKTLFQDGVAMEGRNNVSSSSKAIYIQELEIERHNFSRVESQRLQAHRKVNLSLQCYTIHRRNIPNVPSTYISSYFMDKLIY